VIAARARLARLCGVALAIAEAAAPSAAAQVRAVTDDPRAARLAAEESAHTAWTGRAQAVADRRQQAEARLRNALAAYVDMRARNYPRGSAKTAVMKEVEDAKQAVSDARAAEQALARAAEDAGVPPAWVRVD
jgi:hypothetical protein